MVPMTLRDIRESAHLTQDDVANELGVSRPTYAKWESDTGSMTISQAKRVASILSSKFEDIFLSVIAS